MSNDMSLEEQAVHDKVQSQIKTTEAKLEALKARAEAATVNAEAKAIATLEPKKQEIEQKLQDLKTSGSERFEQAKSDFDARVAEIENSINETDSQTQAN